MRRFNRTLPALLVAITVSLFFASEACQAQYWSWTFELNGDQEVPPSGSSGVGQGFVGYDSISGILFWEISFSGLEGDVTSAHFHGPANRDQNAGVQVNIGAISGLKSPMIGQVEISYEQSQQLVNGLWYVNIHTDAHPAGEIRGQVESCMTLSVDKLRARDNSTFTVTGGQPGQVVAIVWGFEPGVTVIDDLGGYCATFNIDGIIPRRTVGTAVLNPDAQIVARIPKSGSGWSVLFQAATQTCPDSCTSNVFGGIIE